MTLFDVKAIKKDWFIAKTQCQDNWIIKKATQSIVYISAAFSLLDPILTMETYDRAYNASFHQYL